MMLESSLSFYSKWFLWIQPQQFPLVQWQRVGNLPRSCIYGFFISMIVYPIFGNWVWGGGWLSDLGTLILDLDTVMLILPVPLLFTWLEVLRLWQVLWSWVHGLGKYNKDGTPNAIPGHNIPMAIIGTFILAFGWFGFNPGSTLAGTDLRIAIVATNTMLASAAGAFSATLYDVD